MLRTCHDAILELGIGKRDSVRLFLGNVFPKYDTPEQNKTAIYLRLARNDQIGRCGPELLLRPAANP